MYRPFLICIYRPFPSTFRRQNVSFPELKRLDSALPPRVFVCHLGRVPVAPPDRVRDALFAGQTRNAMVGVLRIVHPVNGAAPKQLGRRRFILREGIFNHQRA